MKFLGLRMSLILLCWLLNTFNLYGYVCWYSCVDNWLSQKFVLMPLPSWQFKFTVLAIVVLVGSFCLPGWLSFRY